MSVGVNGRGVLANDLIKTCSLYAGSKIVAATHLTVSGAVSFEDATTVGLTDGGIPTIFPGGSDDLKFLLNSSSIPEWRFGTYDVTFTPGLEWDFSGGASASRTAYNSAAGTATVVISAASNHVTFTLTGYNGVSRTLPDPGDFYFRAFKQGSDTSKLVAQEYKDSLAPFDGFIRLMTDSKVNREAIVGVTYGTLDTFMDADSACWKFFGAPLPPEVIVEIAEDCGMTPWVNIYDTCSDAAVTELATRTLAALPDGMSVAIEYSNEMWNFGAAFSQSSDLLTRATAASVNTYVQYARELDDKIDLWLAVFTGQTERVLPVAAWQSTASTSNWTALLNEGNLYQKLYGVAIAPYAGGGIGGYNIGNYNSTTGFSKADRDLILTDAEAFKDAAFAALELANDAAIAQWYTFVNLLRDYCVSKSLSRTALRPMTYEHAPQHIVEQNTPSASSQDTLTQDAFAEMLRDGRMGDLAAEQMEKLADVGADLCFFDLANPAVGSSMTDGVWGAMDTVTDTTQEPYASIVDYLNNPPARVNSLGNLLV